MFIYIYIYIYICVCIYIVLRLDYNFINNKWIRYIIICNFFDYVNNLFYNKIINDLNNTTMVNLNFII